MDVKPPYRCAQKFVSQKILHPVKLVISFFFKRFLVIYVCTCLHDLVCTMCEPSRWARSSETIGSLQASASLQLELQVVVSCHVGAGTCTQFFGRAVSIPNNRAISPTPAVSLGNQRGAFPCPAGVTKMKGKTCRPYLSVKASLRSESQQSGKMETGEPCLVSETPAPVVPNCM